MNKFRLVLFLSLGILAGGCAPGSRPSKAAPVTREEFASLLKDACRHKLQTHVEVKEAGDTVWVYLPYTPGRQGIAASLRKDDGLYIEYSIASLNPFRPKDPPELRILVQKVLGEMRNLLLRTRPPYEYFVVVVAEVSSKIAEQEDWYYGYMPDVRDYRVGLDFAGEGYRRLAWHA
ncbi:MAG: hypothetical protein ACM3L6_01475, partial [Deltaproteobacteria bacterium]